MKDIIYQTILEQMQNGVMLLDSCGKIQSMNPMCQEILKTSASDLGRTFAEVFFEAENDTFCQLILDAVYEKRLIKNALCQYGLDPVKQLLLTVSYLTNQEEKNGCVIIVNDVTELNELKEKAQMLDEIKCMNQKLESRNQLLKQIFGRYLSDKIVSQLLETSDGKLLDGKKCEVTMFMTDLRGFTNMSEAMPAASLFQMLNHYLSEMIDIIQKYQGTIIDFIGDAIFVAFGAPIQNELHSQAAAQCAIEMQQTMERVNQYNREHNFPDLQMGISLHSDEVLAGEIGNVNKAKYGVVGFGVNYCSRIESITLGEEIAISEKTYQELKNEELKKRCSYKGEYTLKGIDEKVKVYSLQWSDYTITGES